MIGDFIYGNENKEDAIMYLIGQEIKVSENRERRKTDRNEKKWLELVGVWWPKWCKLYRVWSVLVRNWISGEEGI